MGSTVASPLAMVLAGARVATPRRQLSAMLGADAGQNADDTRCRSVSLDRAADPADQCPITNRHDDRVECTSPHQLEPDRPGPLRDRGFLPVPDQDAPVGRRGVAPRRMLDGGVVALDQPHLRTKTANPLLCDRAGARLKEDAAPVAVAASRIGHRLAEVAAGGTDQVAAGADATRQEVGAAALEGPQRIAGLVLDEDATAQMAAQGAIDVLGAVQEHGVDDRGSRGDAGRIEVAVVDHHALTVRGSRRKPFDNLPVHTHYYCVPTPRLNLDETDQRLLGLLQRDSSATLFDLGLEVGLSTSAVQRRITRYRQANLIQRQVTVLDPGAFADIVLALVMVTLDRESTDLHDTLQRRLLSSPAVQQCYDLAGEYDYAVLLAVRGMAELSRVVDDLFMDAPNLKRFDTFPVLRTVKASLEIPTE